MSIVITGGLVFDGTGSAATLGEVVVDGERITEVRAGLHPELHEGHDVVDATGCTVMPGLIESHAHLTFPSAVGHIDPSFNPPLDVSFFGKIEGFPSELARAERNARILLDAGFTSAFSAGSLIPMPTEVALRDKIAAGVIPGPRLKACAAERDAMPRGPQPVSADDWRGPVARRQLGPRERGAGLRHDQAAPQQRRRLRRRRQPDHAVHRGREPRRPARPPARTGSGWPRTAKQPNR